MGDMMTWGCGAVCPNIRLNFTKNTRPIMSRFMDVTIGHIYNSKHKYKPKNLQTMETRKRGKYSQHYQRQRLAFAPTVVNTMGQCGPDFLQFLWILADQAANTQSGSHVQDNLPRPSRILRLMTIIDVLEASSTTNIACEF